MIPNPDRTPVTAIPLLGLDIAQGLLMTPYIDAEDGSPILDIKPYQPSIDRIRETSLPEWCRHWPQYAEDSATFDWESEFLFPR